MKTLNQWLDSEVKRMQQEYDCSKSEALECRTFGEYWVDYIQPLLAQGEQVPHSVAKVLAQHDRLWYVQKFYPEQAKGFLADSGRVV